jgi:hypothetical protein
MLANGYGVRNYFKNKSKRGETYEDLLGFAFFFGVERRASSLSSSSLLSFFRFGVRFANDYWLMRLFINDCGNLFLREHEFDKD